ncbi:hypothetical protein [Flammeovirga sp. OC4]|uniref:hypothetical protein n=1 Tax=Flammeovirga sp. OC4 TaxID=1382345 RepID=UPI0005C4F156|nr:hypothetical protein [Flammeovirga sp. OC4]
MNFNLKCFIILFFGILLSCNNQDEAPILDDELYQITLTNLTPPKINASRLKEGEAPLVVSMSIIIRDLNDCSSVFEENLGSDYSSEIILPLLPEGNYKIQVVAISAQTNVYIDMMFVELTENMTVEVNLENYSSRIKAIDTSDFDNDDVSDIEIKLNYTKIKSMVWDDCTSDELLLNEEDTPDGTISINTDNFNYHGPIYVTSITVEYYNSEGLIFTEDLPLEEPFWLKKDISYEIELDLTEIFNSQSEVLKINWIVTDWTTEKVVINLNK